MLSGIFSTKFDTAYELSSVLTEEKNLRQASHAHVGISFTSPVNVLKGFSSFLFFAIVIFKFLQFCYVFAFTFVSDNKRFIYFTYLLTHTNTTTTSVCCRDFPSATSTVATAGILYE